MDSSTVSTSRRGGPLWDAAHRQQSVQVWGASRAVGRELTAELLRNGHVPRALTLFGRRPTAFAWQGEPLQVQPMPSVAPPADVAFVCTTRDVARGVLPLLQARGTRVVDLSGVLSEDPQVPLVVEAINGDVLGAFTDQVALPGRSAMPLVRTLSALERVVGLEEVDVFAVAAAACEGSRGILAVREEIAQGLDAPDDRDRRLGNFQAPRTEAGYGLGFERVVANDVRRVLGRADLPIDLMAVEGDAERCDVFAVKARLREPLTPENALALFSETPMVEIDPSEQGPAPARCAGSDRVHVGRIRAGSAGSRSLCFFAVADQLRAGATAAALRVASRLPVGG